MRERHESTGLQVQVLREWGRRSLIAVCQLLKERVVGCVQGDGESAEDTQEEGFCTSESRAWEGVWRVDARARRRQVRLIRRTAPPEHY